MQLHGGSSVNRLESPHPRAPRDWTTNQRVPMALATYMTEDGCWSSVGGEALKPEGVQCPSVGQEDGSGVAIKPLGLNGPFVGLVVGVGGLGSTLIEAGGRGMG